MDRLDLAPELVVDRDLVEFGFGGLAEGFAGRGIADLELAPLPSRDEDGGRLCG